MIPCIPMADGIANGAAAWPMWIALNQTDVSYVWTYLAALVTLGLALFCGLDHRRCRVRGRGEQRRPARRCGRSSKRRGPHHSPGRYRRPRTGDACRRADMSLRSTHPRPTCSCPCPEPASGGTRTRSTPTTSASRSPRREIGAFLYIRYQPAFPLCQGGVCIFRGSTTSAARHRVPRLRDHDAVAEIDGNTITTANGLRIEFIEPGRKARITYASADGSTSLDVAQTAVTPAARPRPRDARRGGPPRRPVPRTGRQRAVHALHRRAGAATASATRSTATRRATAPGVRSAPRSSGAVPVPPVGWSPMYFGEDLIFNQISFEAPDTDPAWAGLFEVPATGRRTTSPGSSAATRPATITRVRRNVLEYHPQTLAALRQEIEAEDEHGEIHRFTGEAIAWRALPAWPNASFRDSVYRWEDEQGRVAHATYQEIWFDTYQRAMKRRAPAGVPCLGVSSLITNDYDVIVIGAGHNGLTAAAYLARAGLRDRA